MSEQWRILDTQAQSAARNMAIDRAILTAHSQGAVPPTLRVYCWAPPAISIGYFQSLTEEVDLNVCKRLGIDYVRRITGGGAVFHDKEVTYSLVISESHPEIPKNILKSYERICHALVRGFSYLGVTGKYVPINDIVIKGKKISGNAQTRKENTVLQHGTILLDVDVDRMFSLLKVPSEKIKDKLIADVKQRVTSLRHVLERPALYNEVVDILKRGFEEEFKVHLVSSTLTQQELRLADRYEKECFGLPQWNHKR